MRIALGIEYDGTSYSGWQTQPHGNTVQDELQRAISQVANEPIGVVCAGRTDAGVHATSQISHFDTEVVRAMDRWQLGINACLPSDITVHSVAQVAEDFHARFSATQRTYRYIILNRRYRSALLNQRVHFEPRPLEHELMQQAALTIIGEHDFSAFRAASCQAHSPIRTISQLSVRRVADFVIVEISANAFLQNMVRIIVGALIRIGRGDETIDWMANVLNGRDRRHLGNTAPATGLYLTAVRYPESFEVDKFVPAVDEVLPYIHMN